MDIKETLRKMSPVPHTSPIEPVKTYVFLDAMHEVLNGRKIRRIGWDTDTEAYVHYQDDFIRIHLKSGVNDAWNIGRSDIEADDWVVLPEGN